MCGATCCAGFGASGRWQQAAQPQIEDAEKLARDVNRVLPDVVAVLPAHEQSNHLWYKLRNSGDCMRIFLLAMPVVLGCGDGSKEVSSEELMASCVDYTDKMARAFAVCEGEEEWESEEELSAWITEECDGSYSYYDEAGCTAAAMSLFECGINGGWAAYADECSDDGTDEMPVGCESEEESLSSCMDAARGPLPCDLLAAYFCDLDAESMECGSWTEYAAEVPGDHPGQDECQNVLDGLEAAE
jgi:hypothetical protein